MKLLFIIKALANEGGGAEKVLTQVSSGLAMRGHEVTILSSDNCGSEPYYTLAANVRLRQLSIGDTKRVSGFVDTWRRMRCYRKIVMDERPDVVVAFMHSAFVPAAFALFGSGIPLLASEHIGPEHYRNRPLQRILLQSVPLLAKQVTVVSAQIRNSFGAWLRRCMTVMPNPVLINRDVTGLVRKQPGRLVLLCVGRLAAQKDHKTLIDAFARIRHKHPGWVLRIVGEGELRFMLESQINDLGIADAVQLPGAISQIDAEYQTADLFVLPSRYESFGLATAEALLHGLPAVGFSDCAGTNDLIEDQINGRLVRGDDRTQSLSEVLDHLMSNEAERNRLASSSRAALLDKWGLDAVLDRWERLIVDTVFRSGQADIGAM